MNSFQVRKWFRVKGLVPLILGYVFRETKISATPMNTISHQRSVVCYSYSIVLRITYVDKLLCIDTLSYSWEPWPLNRYTAAETFSKNVATLDTSCSCNPPEISFVNYTLLYYNLTSFFLLYFYSFLLFSSLSLKHPCDRNDPHGYTNWLTLRVFVLW